MKNLVLKSLLLATSLFLYIGVVQAQVTVGPRIGLNLASAQYNTNYSFSNQPDTRVKLGAQVGMALNAQFGKVAVQPSLLFSQKGSKANEQYIQTTVGTSSRNTDALLNYLEVPVNLVYTISGKQGLQLFAGPYVGVGLSGKFKESIELEEISAGSPTNYYSTERSYKVRFINEQSSNENKIHFRRLNMGINGGVGYKIGSLQAQASYAFGLSNIAPAGLNSRYSVKDRTIQFSVAYFFGTNN